MTTPSNTIYLIPGFRAWNRQKNPDQVSDIKLDWSRFLESTESIASVTTESSSVTVDSSSYSGQTTTHFISGGSDGSKGYVDVTITTDNATARTFKTRIKYKVQEETYPCNSIWGWR